jgi:anti-anti-sigma factor
MAMTVTQHPLGEAWLVEVAGEADLAAVPELRRLLDARRHAGTRSLIADLSGLTFVNTPVWALFIEYYQWAAKTGGRIAIAGLQGRALASFETVHLGAFIPHFPTVEEALA